MRCVRRRHSFSYQLLISTLAWHFRFWPLHIKKTGVWFGSWSSTHCFINWTFVQLFPAIMIVDSFRIDSAIFFIPIFVTIAIIMDFPGKCIPFNTSSRCLLVIRLHRIWHVFITWKFIIIIIKIQIQIQQTLLQRNVNSTLNKIPCRMFPYKGDGHRKVYVSLNHIHICTE